VNTVCAFDSPSLRHCIMKYAESQDLIYPEEITAYEKLKARLFEEKLVKLNWRCQSLYMYPNSGEIIRFLPTREQCKETISILTETKERLMFFQQFYQKDYSDYIESVEKMRMIYSVLDSIININSLPISAYPDKIEVMRVWLSNLRDLLGYDNFYNGVLLPPSQK